MDLGSTTAAHLHPATRFEATKLEVFIFYAFLGNLHYFDLNGMANLFCEDISISSRVTTISERYVYSRVPFTNNSLRNHPHLFFLTNNSINLKLFHTEQKNITIVSWVAVQEVLIT